MCTLCTLVFGYCVAYALGGLFKFLDRGDLFEITHVARTLILHTSPLARNSKQILLVLVNVYGYLIISDARACARACGLRLNDRDFLFRAVSRRELNSAVRLQ